ncbi:MAG TPA: hypothetical protein VFP72_05470 [Kineosporiaceae bacterium]|nr:hypothetical protein [Kineosporiaceae bacterium]
MSSPASGSLRAVRVAVIAVIGTLLAAVAHVAGAGRLPGVGPTALAAVVPALGGLWLSRRRRGWPSIVAVLGGVQFVLHSWFMAATATTGCLVHAAGHAGHLGVTGVRCSPAAMPGMQLPVAPTDTGSGSVGLLIAHVLAVAATAAVLAAGERALWELVQWLRPVLLAVTGQLALPVLPGRPGAVPASAPVLRWRTRIGLGGTGRRGPPAGPRPATSLA